MLKNYLISALRNFRRHSFFSVLNIAGLSLGIASALLILQYVQYEESYDRFHSQAEDIYRIQYNSFQNGELSFECASAVPAVGPALLENFPEVKSFVRMLPTSGVITYLSPTRGEVSFREKKIQLVDAAIFDVFDFTLIKGDRSTCLDDPSKVVITESIANKYFGDEEPIGKQLSFDGNQNLTVSGVITDVPENSHIKFGFLVSNQYFALDWEEWETSWGWYDHNTFVAVEPGTDMIELQQKWDEFLYDQRGEDWEKYGFRQEFLFQPLTDIHLKSNLLQESEPDEQGDYASVQFLSAIAIFLLIIAWVNYINLSTARSMDRANEVGVRKVMGANKQQLRNQFLIESVLLNLVATALAVVLVIVLWPSFVDLTGRNIPFVMLGDPRFWATVLILFIAGAFLAGFYPALVLSAFRPVVVLKGKINSHSAGNVVRKGLVVFQFLTSVILIIGSIVVYQQLQFMKQQDIGIDINQTLVVEGPGVVDSLFDSNLESFKVETSKLAEVQAVTASSNIPGHEIIWTRGTKRLVGGPETWITSYVVAVDDNYFPALQIPVIAGRNFSVERPNDQEQVILNEAMVEALEFESLEAAIGAKVTHSGDTLEVAGVIADYNQLSLKNTPNPMVFRFFPSNSFFAFKVQSQNYPEVIEKIQNYYAEIFPGNPFDYFFLDQFFNRQYDQERRFSQTFGLFTLLAILIACLGLFGLASFMTTRRTKEIGIRKVLGSSKASILTTLSSGFMKLVLLGTVLGFPLAWYLMEQWLQKFPYRVDLHWWVFVLAGVIVFVIALLSVSYQTLKTASVNPANSLRYE